MLQQIISLLKEILAELVGIRAALQTLSVQELPVEQELLDNSDAIRLLKISDKTLYRWRKQKLITAHLIGNKHYYFKAELTTITTLTVILGRPATSHFLFPLLLGYGSET
jgi:hypothetical protein